MKIFIHLVDLVGPQNACIGLGQQLIRRGHSVYFLINGDFANKFSRFSKKFIILPLETPRLEAEKNAVELNAENFSESGLFGPISPIMKVKKMFGSEFIQGLGRNADFYESQIKAYIQQEKPDVIMVDAQLMSPCLMNSSIPWVYIFCCNPLGLFCDLPLPPFSSGLPIDADPKEWSEFRKILHKDYFDKVVEMYATGTLLSWDTFIRDDPEPFELPNELKSKMKPGDKLIFLSMGSMGSCNIKLMRTLIAILAKTPHFYIVSKGMLHDQYELANNMWGEAYVRQIKIIPMVDLIIFHGGNNTLTETFYFGKPMIILPLFFDQFDNAQRVHEKGFGIRLNIDSFTEKDLLDAIETLLNDQTLKDRLIEAKNRINQSQSLSHACERIERIVQANQKLD
ncbi:UDP-glucuronosyltransferase 2B10 [Sarcoptes scabiei]|uniref:UDP-glucuronosyltransferase 2B10 n=1 Tax=Sarcoptes scabiei TaxID=52283 RepID=A0A834VFQ6_SARSC|nr:UDP-glucuronosyltransferase 2B10 [Sarcoptes scabiei]